MDDDLRSRYRLPRRDYGLPRQSARSNPGPSKSTQKPAQKPPSLPPKNLSYESPAAKPGRKPYLKAAILIVVLLAIAGAIAVALSSRKPAKPSAATGGSSSAAVQAQQQTSAAARAAGQAVQQPTTSAASQNQPPAFTVYYPDSPPSGLSVDKTSISYSKDSFIFALVQTGQDQFFINEQPAGQNFSYQRLKVKLGSPMDIKTALGAGIFGTIGSNFVTAVNTDKNTLILVNCTALQCGGPSLDLIASLQINTNPTHIH